MAADEAQARTSRRVGELGVGLAVALVIGLAALRRDVRAIEIAAPDGSVGTAAIQDSAVTADKLADRAVTTAALASGAVAGGTIARGAVGASQLAPAAVTAAKVKRDSLTGATIRESTLSTVPSGALARRAQDATRLGGSRSSAYLSHVSTVRATSSTDTLLIEGPIEARCPPARG